MKIIPKLTLTLTIYEQGRPNDLPVKLAIHQADMHLRTMTLSERHAWKLAGHTRKNYNCVQIHYVDSLYDGIAV